MDIQKAREFVLKAGQSTYASGDSSLKEIQSDKSTTISFSDPDYPGFLFHDNYFGGEPYGGREVVFYNNLPIWMMVYYGRVEKGIEVDKVYEVLMSALRKSSLEMPYRGPESLVIDGWRYQNKVSGEFKNFRGIEQIYNGEELVYQASYMGGLVDQHG